MKIIMKFKDGSLYAQDFSGEITKTGEGDFLEGLLVGKKNNSDIEIEMPDQKISKKYNELYSVEIIF